MCHRHCFEAVERTFIDILLPTSIDMHIRPFGGKTILLGGNFRQILSVVINGTKEEIINASLTQSNFWKFFKIYS